MDGRCAATRSVAQQASIDWRRRYLADHVGTMQSRDPFTSLFCLFFSSPTPRKKKEKEHSQFLKVQSPCLMFPLWCTTWQMYRVFAPEIGAPLLVFDILAWNWSKESGILVLGVCILAWLTWTRRSLSAHCCGMSSHGRRVTSRCRWLTWT